MCAVCCVQLLHTILHRTDLIIFPPALQTIIIAPMMSIWRKGGRASSRQQVVVEMTVADDSASLTILVSLPTVILSFVYMDHKTNGKHTSIMGPPTTHQTIDVSKVTCHFCLGINHLAQYSVYPPCVHPSHTNFFLIDDNNPKVGCHHKGSSHFHPNIFRIMSYVL